MTTELQTEKCRLLILESDPHVRDTCTKFADDLHFDVYSTSYVEGIDSVIWSFKPTSVVIDVGLFDDDRIKLYDLVTKIRPPMEILFVAGDDERFVEAAEYMALSMGLHVKGILQRPINETLLLQFLGNMK
ncbi:MAG: hypothetical protein KJP16_11080 [Gammaproteobacteria bacterium]|nr:hypothetical protein [Gammaproteobacteria bacterium]NNL51353.1 hypothetical protein [Woeseiaceae bacterium]